LLAQALRGQHVPAAVGQALEADDAAQPGDPEGAAAQTLRGKDIGDFGRSRAARCEAALALTMSERLARMHALCKQMSAIKGAASAS